MNADHLTAQTETPLAGRRAGDAIAGGVRSRIFHTNPVAVKGRGRRSRGA